MNYTISALYHFADFTDFKDWQEPLKMLCAEQGICGTLLLAPEGINGTVAGSGHAIPELHRFLKADKRFEGLESKESFAEKKPFYRLKIKLKKEIVTLGKPEANPAKLVGTYVEPKDWNAIVNNPDIPLIDTRNDYEYGIGTFKGAVDPQTQKFTQFPEFVEKNFDPKKNDKVAMFCTGGIRCEKASAYMLSRGFKEVYHLKGGILKYLEEVPESDSTWEGSCFVFDRRVGVEHGLKPSNLDMCFGCRHPISNEDKAHEDYIEGVQCAHCKDMHSAEDKARFTERQKQIRLAKSRNEVHIGG